MTPEPDIIKENEKRYPRFSNFGKLLFYSYARSAMPLCYAKNVQMLCAAINLGKTKYDRSCYMFPLDYPQPEHFM